ncbi:pantoate--beta-alanine ligase [soil metagenome]
MKVARTRRELRAALAGTWGDQTVGLVPTMGALHAGHLSLLRAATERCDLPVVSVFVNPLQFGPQEDFAGYPRDERTDLEVLAAHGAAIAWLPAAAEMYPPGHSTFVDVGPLACVYEGEVRPGHFRGVCTVVAMLFNLARCDRAFFGQKDAQQVAVVNKMVNDMAWPVAITVCPTVREEDGLALSSRNAYLSSEGRSHATALYRSLTTGRSAWLSGASSEACAQAMRDVLDREPGVSADYAAVVDPVTFSPVHTGPALLIVAALVGTTRLIDNLPAEARSPSGEDD